jgi:hypothetical protein
MHTFRNTYLNELNLYGFPAIFFNEVSFGTLLLPLERGKSLQETTALITISYFIISVLVAVYFSA